jgi:glycogen(starch) synthase
MRVCLLSLEYPPESHRGGIGTYTYNIAAGLARSGHEVHVITSTRRIPASHEEAGVSVHKVRESRIRPGEASRLMYSLQVAHKALSLRPFDIVQANEFRSEAFILSYLRQFPLITRLATPFSLTEKLNGVLVPKRPLFDCMERLQTVRSTGILSSTRALARIVAESWRIDASRIHVIPNSVDVSRVVQLGMRADIPRMLDGRDFVVYFGRLEERKGVQILAKALPAVFELCPSILMVFIGADAPYRGESMRDRGYGAGLPSLGDFRIRIRGDY